MNALQAALAKLGNTAEEVYRALKEAGIQGKRKSCSSCPIANYLKRELNYDHVVVGGDNGIDARPGRFQRQGGAHLDEGCIYRDEPHTAATRAFVKQFDGGCYDSLTIRQQ